MDGEMIRWGIFYTHPDTSRRQYMQVGFESPEQAQNELDRILRGKKEWQSKNDISHYDIYKCPSFLIGEDWEIKEIKIKTT